MGYLELPEFELLTAAQNPRKQRYALVCERSKIHESKQI
jgi:hypothetical protein